MCTNMCTIIEDTGLFMEVIYYDLLMLFDNYTLLFILREIKQHFYSNTVVKKTNTIKNL